jgi:hypothetical protein
VLVVASAIAVRAANAQHSGDGLVRLSLSAGVMQYELFEARKAPVVSARLDLRLVSFLLLEAGVTGAHLGYRFDQAEKYVFPEVQVQLQLPIPYVKPYVGAGIGTAYLLREGERPRSSEAFSASGGLRARLGDYFGARVEVRTRIFGSDYSAGTAELTAGLSYRL